MNRKTAIINGESFYDTGRPCSHGHISKRYASTGCCVECTKMYSAKIRQSYADTKRAKMLNMKKIDIVVYREDEQAARDFITALNTARESIRVEELRQSLVRNGLQPPGAFDPPPNVFMPKAIPIDTVPSGPGKPFSLSPPKPSGTPDMEDDYF